MSNELLKYQEKALKVAIKLLKSPGSNSLLKRYLTKEIIKKLNGRTTSYGSTLYDCVNAGIEDVNSEVGIYAADPECYELFAELFNPIIEEYHKIERTTMHPGPGTNWGIVSLFKDLDPGRKYIVGTRVRCCRNLKGYPFSPLMTSDHEIEVQLQLRYALRQLTGELQGTFHTLLDLPQSAHRTFVANHYYNLRLGPSDVSSNTYCPSGASIFFNEKKTFSVWMCEEDHVTVLSMQEGAHVGEVLERMITGVNHLQQRMEFATNERFGFLTACPSNLGHSVRMYVRIKVPRLAINMTKFKELAASYDIQVTDPVTDPCNFAGIYELCNGRCLGCTEFQCMRKFCTGITAIIDAERNAPEVTILFKKDASSQATM